MTTRHDGGRLLPLRPNNDEGVGLKNGQNYGILGHSLKLELRIRM